MTGKHGYTIAKTLNGLTRSAGQPSFSTYSIDYLDYFDMITYKNHGWKHPGVSADVGGPFYLFKVENKVGVINIYGDYTRGPITVSSLTTEPGLSISKSSDSEIYASGTTGMARSTPNNPVFSMATALGELRRDGIPAAIGVETWQSRTLRAKNAGSEYLNYEFGWLPLVSDIRKFCYSVKNHEKILDGYRRGSDKKIHRRYDFEPVTSQVVSAGNARFTLNKSELNGQGTITREYTKLKWFEGAFRYHVPVGDTQLSKVRQHASYANKLLGLKLTPDVLWNITPWSWAADWFTNTGDIMKNISNMGTDGLVMQYGYSMHHTERRDTRTATNNFGCVTRVETTSYKQRLPSNPYGFSATWPNFSSKQKAIIAAIGLTHGGVPTAR